MNKQELKKQVSSLPSELIFKKVMVNKDSVLELIDQLDEPQKVVIPKFVAEWIEDFKQTNYAIPELLSSCMTDEVDNWYHENSEQFMRAWLDGYEIEQEKPETLYTVEIPNPLLTNNTRYGQKTVLRKFKNGVLLTEVTGWDEQKHYEIYHLTESEIRKDFEWAWQAGFAKEVE